MGHTPCVAIHFCLLILINTFFTYGSGQSTDCPGVDMVKRSAWNAKAAKATTTMSNLPVKYFFVHHTAGPSCNSETDCSSVVRGIQNYHMDKKDWSDIGYSFLVGEDGRVYEGRGWDNVGAHTYGYNSKSFAASFMGTYTDHKPGPAAINATKSLIACGIKLGKIAKDYRLYGHRDIGDTQCPGDKLYEEIQGWPHYGEEGSDHCSTVNIISRSGWKARQPKDYTTMPSAPVKYFFVHRRGGLECSDADTCSEAAKGHQDYYMDTLGWDDVGYSFLVGEDGNVYEGRGWGHQGAHTSGYNDRSFAAAFMGDYTYDKPGTKALDAAKNLIACGIQLGKIASDYCLYDHIDMGKANIPDDKLYTEIKGWSKYCGKAKDQGAGKCNDATAKDIACKLLDLGDKRTIGLWKKHPSGVVDNAYAYNNIRDTCNGLQASRSDYSCTIRGKRHSSPGGYVCLNSKLLQYIWDVHKKVGYIHVNEIAGACHSTTSRHYRGTAVDLHKMPGQNVTYINMCTAIGGFGLDEGRHVHCQLG